MSTSWAQVRGSHPRRPAGAERVGDADPDAEITLTITVQGRDQDGLAATLDGLDELSAGERRHLSREELATRHGADPSDLERVASFCREQSMEVLEQSSARRCVTARGRADAVAGAFHVRFGTYRHPDGEYRGLDGPYSLPEDLAFLITAVLGLEDRPQATHHHVVYTGSTANAFAPAQVGRIYDFPTGVSGVGACIGILELGGGFVQSDLETFFTQAGLPVPSVTTVSVDGATNAPSGGTGADVEVALDIEVAGSIANGARIVVYFAPNTDAGFYDVLTTAVNDRTNHPTVLSISWGGAESTWTDQAMQQMEQALADAAAVGVTVAVASGDSGSSDGVDDGLAHVDFPASAPHALGCGGTRLTASGDTWTSDVVWNASGGATGGGVSAEFALPSYQGSANVPVSANPGGKAGRGVPDVAADADPETGYAIYVGGASQTVGGTSASAPLWAGLTALCTQGLGKPPGFLNPLVYPLLGTASFHPVTSGTNGAYRAGPGWNPCCGLGTPNGANLLAALRA